MREFGVKVSALRNEDVGVVTRALRAVPGVTTVEIDVSSGWVFARGEACDEAALLAAVRIAGLVPVYVQHDAPPDPVTGD